jgi:sporulation protein YlmC with PRC-barrel domain
MNKPDNIIGPYRPGPGPGPEVMGASTLTGDVVVDLHGEPVGHIREIMLDIPSGRIAYAVLAFAAGAEHAAQSAKLFAVPWAALRLDSQHRRFVLDADKERLRHAPGFDPEHWPSMAEPTWTSILYEHYGVEPYGH